MKIMEHFVCSCLKMLRFLLLSALVLCGQCSEELKLPEGSSRVVGGYEVRRNSWPWQISLQYLSGGYWYHNCGGSLIRTNWVLTAAHCVDSYGTYRVSLGDHNIYEYEEFRQVIDVNGIIVHPWWNTYDVSAGNDIAILRLSYHAHLNHAVQVAQLPGPDVVLYYNHPCTVTGWGYTSTHGSVSATLQEAPLPVVDYDSCSHYSYWGGTVKPTMVCAGGNGVQSGCSGDSGGPLNCHVNGRYEVHGVTSFGSAEGCNTYYKPTVFTRVSAFIYWINDNINANS